jgi:hypothetical protein
MDQLQTTVAIGDSPNFYDASEYFSLGRKIVGRRKMNVLASIFGLLLGLSQAHAGTVLITEQEASLPPEVVVVGDRGITRGPRIELTEQTQPTHSPLHFQIRFKSFGGSEIKTESLHVIYLKTPEIDITPRVARYTQPIGIDIPDAEVPAGEHYIRIEVADSDGRTRSSIFVLKVVR